MDIPKIVAYVQSGGSDSTQPHYVPLLEQAGVDNKSLLPLGGKKMIQHVLEAVDSSKYIHSIVISGVTADDLAPYHPQKPVDFIEAGETSFQSVMNGIEYLSAKENPPRYMCSIPSDMPLITTQVINRVLEAIDWSQNFEIFQNWVKFDAVTENYPKITKKPLKLKEGTFAGGDFYIYHTGILTPERRKLTEDIMLRRKNFRAIAGILGLKIIIKYIFRRLTFRDIAKRFKRLGIRGAIYITDFPETCLDLDYAEDVDIFDMYCSREPRELGQDEGIRFVTTDDV